jgi:hypothetical protein
MRLARLLAHPASLLAASLVAYGGRLLAAEWAVRAAHPDRLRLSAARSAIVPSAEYGWQLRPNWTQRDGTAFTTVHDAHLHGSAARRAWRSLWERSHLLSLLATPAAAPDEGDGTHWMGRRKRAVKEEETAVRLAVSMMHRLRVRAEGAEARFVVVLHPARAAFEERTDLPGLLAEALRADATEVIDLAALYRESARAFSELALDGAGHLSPRGHQVVADLLGPTLQE